MSKSTKKTAVEASEQLAQWVVKGMQEKKAQDIVVMDMRGVANAFTDFFVIASGTSDTQIEAIADSVDKLLRDFGDELTLEQSIGRGYSMPNTQIPNDRELFEQFIYGNMKSCKEGNSVACAQNNSRHISI